jgi:intraflagellar transport protein 81
MKNEVMEMESRYHLLNCQLALTDHQIRRVSSGPPAERLKERYQQKVAEAEDQVRQEGEEGGAHYLFTMYLVQL